MSSGEARDRVAGGCGGERRVIGPEVGNGDLFAGQVVHGLVDLARLGEEGRAGVGRVGDGGAAAAAAARPGTSVPWRPTPVETRPDGARSPSAWSSSTGSSREA